MNSRLLSRMEELREGKVRAESLGAWKKVKLREVLHERKTYSQKGEGYPHVTLSTKGISPKTERYDRDHLVKDEEKAYKITHKGDICYNPANLKFGVICENTFGDAIFSPIYVTFEVKEGVCREFLANYLMRWDFINAVRKYEEGTVYERMAVKPEDFLRYEIFLPPTEEQRKIAAILTAQDKVIELKEQLLAEKQRQKAYLMQQLLTGKKRLPGFSGAWKKVHLRDLFVYAKKHSTGPSVTYVSSENMLPNLSGTVVFGAEDRQVGGIEYKSGDILIGNIRPYLKKIWLADRSGICSTDVLVLHPLESGLANIHNFIATDRFFSYIMLGAGGSRMPRGDKRQIMEYELALPDSEDEKERLFKILSDVELELDLLRQSIEQERQKKKALMQLLLTGIVRVRP